MKKFIEIPDAALESLKEGKYVDGSLKYDQRTGKVTFRPFNRQPRRRAKDRVICELENGWLKESPERYKFYNSVKKSCGRLVVETVMRRELNAAMEVLEMEKILERV